MSGFDALLFDKLEGVAHVRLNRPNVLNAYNMQMRDDFSQVLPAVQDDPDVGALLITGNGRAFCAGADLTEFGTAPSQSVARRVRWQRDVWGQFLSLSKPVVIAVHGYCIGSGLEITLMGDLRLAAMGTIFALPEVQLGMIPAAGGSQTLPRNVRPGQAIEVLLTGRRFDASEALSMGLVTRVVPPENLLEEAMEAARRLAQLDPDAVAAAKTALRLGQDLPLAEALKLENRLAGSFLG